MRCRKFISIIILFSIIGSRIQASPRLEYSPFKKVYTGFGFSLNFYPSYPLLIGKRTYLRVKSTFNIKKMVLGLENGSLVTMDKKNDYWGTEFFLTDEFREGWNKLILYMYVGEENKTPAPEIKKENLWQKFIALFEGEEEPKFETVKETKNKTVIRPMWFKVFHPDRLPGLSEISEIPKQPIEELPPGGEDIEDGITLLGSREGSALTSPVKGTLEAEGITVKGSKSLTFSLRSLEGSREGFVPGIMREESLRVNISGKIASTEIDANLFSTTSGGTAGLLQNERKLSGKLKRGGTELYFGDFTDNMDNLEFSRIDKSLSGLKLTGDYDRWGFKLLGSSPQGESKTWKSYGDGTQGPYYLGFAPLVVDSEKVSIDNKPQKRGDDYDINYTTGYLTFKDRVILKDEIIEANFSFRETTYQHSTYAARAKGKINSNLNLGVTYIIDSDSMEGAQSVKSQTGISPQSHSVIGTDCKVDLGSFLQAESEIAISEKNLDLLSPDKKEQGKAGKLKTESSFGPISLSTRLKKISATFQSIGDVKPKQNLWEYGWILGYRPNRSFFLEGGIDKQIYTWDTTPYSLETQNFKAKILPQDWPSLGYQYYKEDLSHDLVSKDQISRQTVRNSADTEYRIGFINSSLKLTREDRVNRTPSEEARAYKAINFGLATVGLDKIFASGNMEYKRTDESSGLKYSTKTYDMNLSLAPTKDYFLSAGINQIDDSKEGSVNTSNISYKAQPLKIFKTDGKYTITSIKEDFSGTQEVISKQTGSFTFDLRPVQQVRFRYLLKPNFTLVRRTNTLSYNNMIYQTELMWAPLKELSLGMTQKNENTINIDRTDMALTRKKNSEDKNSTMLSLKSAPWKILSIELTYSTEDKKGEALDITDYSYTPSIGDTKKLDASAKTSLSEKFSIDSKYSITRIKEGSREASTNTQNSLRQTASLRGLWELNDNWTVSAGSAYTFDKNYLAVTDKETYTISPAFGFIYKIGSSLRIDGDYTYSKSYQSSATEKINYSLKTKWSPNEFVNLTLRAEQEISRVPDYKTSEILGNVEINL